MSGTEKVPQGQGKGTPSRPVALLLTQGPHTPVCDLPVQRLASSILRGKNSKNVDSIPAQALRIQESLETVSDGGTDAAYTVTPLWASLEGEGSGGRQRQWEAGGSCRSSLLSCLIMEVGRLEGQHMEQWHG